MVGPAESPEEPTFTLQVTPEGEEHLRLTARAAVAVAAQGRNLQRQGAVIAMVFVGVGLAAVWTSELRVLQLLFGAVAIAGGLAVWFRQGRPGGLEASVTKQLRRDPSAGLTLTYLVGPDGLRTHTELSDVWWSWRRLSAVRDHEGGLLLVFADGAGLALLESSAFVDDEQKTAVAGWVEHWAARAGTPGADWRESAPAPLGDEVFVLPAEDRDGEYLRLLGEAYLERQPLWRRQDVLFTGVCAAIALFSVGQAVATSNPWDLMGVAVGVVGWLLAGRRSAAARLLTRGMRRDPAACGAATYGLGPSGFRRLCDGYDCRFSWQRFEAAADSAGGVVLVVRDTKQYLFIPPWAFTDAPQCRQILDSITHWIAPSPSS